MENTTEHLAADTLLEIGVRVEIPAPIFLKVFGIKRIPFKIYAPSYGTLLRVTRYYLSMGVTIDQLNEITYESALKLCQDHGKTLCKIVAVCMLNGYTTGWLFTRLLASFLLWSLSAKKICSYTELLVVFGGTADFMNTTRSVKTMKITAPMLGQKEKGS